MTNKPERLNDLEQHLLDTLTGVSKRDLADRLGVHIKTIDRYIRELSEFEPIIEESDGTYRIDRGRYSAPMLVTVHDAIGMFIALRHLSNQRGPLKPHAAGAIRTVSEAVRRASVEIADNFREQSRDLVHSGAARHDDRFVRVLEAVTLAWVNRRQVSLIHFDEESGAHEEFLGGVESVFPCAIQGDICVVLATPSGDVWHSVWIDQIRDAEVLDEPFQAERPFSWSAFLAAAQSGEAIPGNATQVELRFSPEVAPLIENTLWHPSQIIEELGQGRLSWKGIISRPERVLFPWIRRWGDDVEIVRPEEMRESFADDLRRVLDKYEELDTVETI